MAACSQISTPILNQQVDPCNGTHTSTNCIFFPNAITYLFIEPNDDLTTVIQNMVLSLQSNNTRTTQLEEENAVQADLITNLQLDLEDLQDSVLDLVQTAPYKVYTALLTQSGEVAPVPTILQNTLGATLSYSRTNEGEYIITTTGTFPQDKTWAVINTPSYDGNGPFALQIGRISNTECNIYAYSLLSGGLQELNTNDDRVSLEIRVYN